MTTKVSIDAHAGWDVDVDLLDGQWKTRTDRVPAFTQRDFFVHSDLSITGIREVKTTNGAPNGSNPT